MASNHEPSTQFTGLVNLLSERLGARALATNDDFFAGMENLVKDAPAIFLPDEYTDRGKWMDGWESRRKRGPGHDWCLLELGVPGAVRAVDIDTSFFLGNHPPTASLEAVAAEEGATVEQLEALSWTEILPQSPLRPGSSNLFVVRDDQVYTHLRLRIYPDGGVARLRAYGDVSPRWRAPEDPELGGMLEAGEADLAALAHGGLALTCSDAFFGPMNNLIAPGRAENMGGGWETRRKRGPGHDWILLRLGAAGTIGTIEVDTNHFKGNYPDRCSLEGIYAPGARLTSLLASPTWVDILPQVKLEAHTRHFFRGELLRRGPFTHVRLRIYPDGGVSRLRVYGRRMAEGPAGKLDAMDKEAARAALARCCGARRWVEAMLEHRPFKSDEALYAIAGEEWSRMERADLLEAFSHHPRIGADLERLREKYASTADWASGEQAGARGASEETLTALRDGNVAYEQRFGHIFIVCATGKSAEQMLAMLGSRIGNEPDKELAIAAAEQAKITRLRLEKL